MKVLMFGWEFPPHISGGLGTACFGLTRGLSVFKDIEILFVVPKAYGDEDKNVAQIIGAGDVKVKKKYFEADINEMTYLEVGSLMVPYVAPEEFEEHYRKKTVKEEEVVETERSGFYEFTGKYGPNLLEEVSNYAKVASIIASQYDFDLIHAHDWLTYAAGVAAKQASGKPLVIHVHATEFDRTGVHVNQQVYDIERMGMHGADRVIAVSNLTRNTVIERYGIHPGKVVTVYNAVEPTSSKNKVKAKKNVEDKIVTFLGRITFQKGPEYFVEAAYKVLQRMKKVRFVMAGSGDMMNKMIVRAAQLGISDRFHFSGFLKGDDVDKMFEISDVYVMPSVSEPFGISPLEAMRSNVPVVISKQSGVAEVIHHAIKTDFWDVDAIADSIYGLLNYEAISKDFKQYGKTEVDNMKWENAAAQVKEVYEKTLREFNK